MKSKGDPYYNARLKAAGMRATAGRVALLELLERVPEPISVEKAARALRGKLDLANTYRALEALVEAGLARRVDVGHRHMHYAFVAKSAHQHQFVCSGCGLAYANNSR